MRVASPAAGQLGNIRKSSKLHRMRASPPAKMNILLILTKNSWKAEIKLFPLSTISHEN